MRTLPALWAQLLGRGKSLTADVWPLPRLLGTIAQLYHDRIEAEAEVERGGHERTPWPQWVLSHMVRASGVRSKALKQLNGLLHSARFYARRSLRAGTFAEVCRHPMHSSRNPHGPFAATPDVPPIDQQVCGLDGPYSEARVMRLVRTLAVCLPRAQLLSRLASTDEQWVPLQAAASGRGPDGGGGELSFEWMVAATFPSDGLAKEREALRAEAAEMAQAEAAESSHPEAIGAAKARIDELVLLLVRGVQTTEGSEGTALRRLFQQAVAAQASPQVLSSHHPAPLLSATSLAALSPPHHVTAPLLRVSHHRSPLPLSQTKRRRRLHLQISQPHSMWLMAARRRRARARLPMAEVTRRQGAQTRAATRAAGPAAHGRAC